MMSVTIGGERRGSMFFRGIKRRSPLGEISLKHSCCRGLFFAPCYWWHVLRPHETPPLPELRQLRKLVEPPLQRLAKPLAEMPTPISTRILVVAQFPSAPRSSRGHLTLCN